jgi:ribulose-5-phosphate 4-epimerase/fuculose-1-phosphate aldolase
MIGFCLVSDFIYLQQVDHPRNIIPQICREFHRKGWMTGSGGAISIKLG